MTFSSELKDLIEETPIFSELWEDEPEENEAGNTPSRRRCRCCSPARAAKYFVCGVIGLALICGITVVTVMKLRKERPPPSSAYEFALVLPIATYDSIRDSATPQSRAYHWFVQSYDETMLRSMETWRKQQIFALVTIYHASNGPAWLPTTQAKWLDSSLSECEWTSTLSDGVNRSIRCSPDGHITALELNSNEDEIDPNLIGTLPPEVALLGALEDIKITSGSEVTLMEMLPPELTRMSALKTIACQNNDGYLVGTIPSYLGQLYSNHNLSQLLLAGNALTGTIPSQLGLLRSNTGISYLDISFNPALTGTIPSLLCSSSADSSTAPPMVRLDCASVECPSDCFCDCTAW